MLEARKHKAVSTDNLVKMARFVLENNYFKFNGDVKKQISGTEIGNRSPPVSSLQFLSSKSYQKIDYLQSSVKTG